MSRELNGADALLMVGASENNADLYYATRFRAPDPFVLLWTASEKLMLANNLEIDRARDQARVDRVLPYVQYEEQVKQKGQEQPNAKDVLLELLRDLGMQKLQVPAEFPLGTADFLRGEGLELDIAGEPLFPQRQIKDDDEIAAIRRAMQATEAGMETAIEGIRAADCRDGELFLDGAVLTSERLRRMVHRTLMDCDSIGEHTIIAGGDAGSCGVPHGLGFLRELELMQMAGMPPIEVLQSATGTSAALLGFSEPIGRLAPGCRTRLIFTRHNPTVDVTVLGREKMILFDGQAIAGSPLEPQTVRLVDTHGQG